MLAQLIGRQLRKKAQLAAAKELLSIIARTLGSSMEEAEAGYGQHLLITALVTLGSLAARLGILATSLLTDSALRLLDTSVLRPAAPQARRQPGGDPVPRPGVQCSAVQCSAVQCSAGVRGGN
jgi:hypothetical protein